MSIPEAESSDRSVKEQTLNKSTRSLGCNYATLSKCKSDGRNALSWCGISRFRAKLELQLEQMEKNWACGLNDTLVVGQMKACDRPGSASLDDTHIWWQLILPCTELIEDTVHLMDVKAFRGLWDAIDLGH